MNAARVAALLRELADELDTEERPVDVGMVAREYRARPVVDEVARAKARKILRDKLGEPR